MKVGCVLRNCPQFIGKHVKLQGIFVLVGEDGYFVDSFEERDNHADAIRIDIPSILDVVTQNVPPSGGSKYCYGDPAKVYGVLLQCEDGDGFKYKISKIEKFIINKSGHELSVFD